MIKSINKGEREEKQFSQTLLHEKMEKPTAATSAVTQTSRRKHWLATTTHSGHMCNHQAPEIGQLLGIKVTYTLFRLVLD